MHGSIELTRLTAAVNRTVMVQRDVLTGIETLELEDRMNLTISVPWSYKQFLTFLERTISQQLVVIGTGASFD